MAYFLDFDERALKEWRKLGSTVREQLKKKLVEVLESPRIEANKLRGMPDCYKIKLRSSGYRLVYQVIDEKVVVFVISVGKRERSEVYSDLFNRHSDGTGNEERPLRGTNPNRPDGGRCLHSLRT